VIFAASAPKGASHFKRLTVSLKRYPDTKPEFFRSLSMRFRGSRARVDRFRRLPGRGWKVAGQSRFGCLALPMAAGQADRPHFPEVSLFRYLILAHCGRARYDRARTLVADISGEVQILPFHLDPRKLKRRPYRS
jgi:hypothetical protein